MDKKEDNKFPKIKKNLKNFILEEDGKVIDSVASKVALSAFFGAATFLLNLDEANAKGHHNHNDHSNHYRFEGNDRDAGNDLNETITKNIKGHNINYPEKTSSAIHANHFNHSNGDGKK
jgi:hypothetical protein